MSGRCNKITLLTNYRDLAKKLNNQQLLNNDVDNPYAWLPLALDAEPNQQLSHAKL